MNEHIENITSNYMQTPAYTHTLYFTLWNVYCQMYIPQQTHLSVNYAHPAPGCITPDGESIRLGEQVSTIAARSQQQQHNAVLLVNYLCWANISLMLSMPHTI